jgi:hypothetical protein
LVPLKIFKIILTSFFVFAGIASAADSISVTAVGDIMMGTDYPTDTLPRKDGANLFKYAAESIQAGDIRFGNFEGTFFDGEKDDSGKSEGKNRYIFRTPTRYVQKLSEAGFNVVSLANNHAMDFGSTGIRSTKQTLTSAGIQFSSKNGGEVAKFLIRGVRVALIACDFYGGRRSISTPQKTFAEISDLRKKFDIVIVSVHAGGEGAGAERVSDRNEIFLGENRGNSVAFAHSAIDAGAGLVLMHGPHVPRGMEVYKDHLVAYSLGNFLTERGISVSGISGLAPLLKIDMDPQGKLVRGYLTSFRQDRSYGTIYDKSASALKFIEKLSAVDFPDSAPRFTGDGYFYPKQ